jgi:hypothetical protein
VLSDTTEAVAVGLYAQLVTALPYASNADDSSASELARQIWELCCELEALIAGEGEPLEEVDAEARIADLRHVVSSFVNRCHARSPRRPKESQHSL